MGCGEVRGRGGWVRLGGFVGLGGVERFVFTSWVSANFDKLRQKC